MTARASASGVLWSTPRFPCHSFCDRGRMTEVDGGPARQENDRKGRRDISLAVLAGVFTCLGALVGAVPTLMTTDRLIQAENRRVVDSFVREQRQSAYLGLLKEEQTARELTDTFTDTILLLPGGEPRIRTGSEPGRLISEVLSPSEFHQLRNSIAPIRSALARVDTAAAGVELVGSADGSRDARSIADGWQRINTYTEQIDSSLTPFESLYEHLNEMAKRREAFIESASRDVQAPPR